MWCRFQRSFETSQRGRKEYMRCPFCKKTRDRVVDSRTNHEGALVRRRRQCLSCKRRFTTYERVERTPRMVIKNDLRRESFARDHVGIQDCGRGLFRRSEFPRGLIRLARSGWERDMWPESFAAKACLWWAVLIGRAVTACFLLGFPDIVQQ